MSEKPKFMTHERIMAGEEYVSYSDYLMLQRERDKAREDATNYYAKIGELEQERDEAIADRDIARLSAHDSDRAHDRMVGELEKVYKERDEAREAAAKWESLFSTMERAGAEQARRADENREWALRAERERDEAREELADWENASAHVEANHPDEVHCGCVPVLRKLLIDARKERDEAREAIIATLEENRHLADGDACTLAKLKSVVPEWK